MNWKAIQKQCKPLDTWLTHLSETKRCVVNILMSLGSIIKQLLADIGWVLKCFAEHNASFINGRQINVLCSTSMKEEWLIKVILCLLHYIPFGEKKSCWPHSISPLLKNTTLTWARLWPCGFYVLHEEIQHIQKPMICLSPSEAVKNLLHEKTFDYADVCKENVFLL